jgi:ABC-type multidrug transport system ATPase subunit
MELQLADVNTTDNVSVDVSGSPSAPDGKVVDNENNINTFQNTLKFNVSFSVGEKKIVTDCYGELRSGDCLAIMGPSGAGKTTFLGILTLDTKGGRSEGEVTLNGESMTSYLFKKRCCVVNQEDFHWAMLTCKETIRYAAQLYLGLSPEDTEKRVVDMLSSTGLESCADTIVGNSFTKGLSGGQKRRLSVAVALLKKLDVIYLDEPTSGLDSASAASIMKFIIEVTKKHKLISLTTIHQPSTAVYNGFDKVMLLSRGRMAYCGGAGEHALQYFTSIGHPITEHMNPAEFMVDLVNSDFNDANVVDNILHSWSMRSSPPNISAVLSPRSQFCVNLREELGECGLCDQILIMFERHGKLSIRDPLLFVGRMGIFLVATLFFAIVYISAINIRQDQVLNRLWYIMWCVGMPANMAVIAVYTYNAEFNAIRREAKNGMTSPIAYLVAMSVLQIPVVILFGMFALTVGAYGVLGFNPDHYIQVITIYACAIYCIEAFAQVFSVLNADPLMGMLNFMQIWFASFLFSGIVVPVEDVIWPFRAFAYILPLKYALKAIVYQEFIDQDWSGASLCDPQVDSPCFSFNDKTGSQEGWTCGNVNDLCFGKEGWQVLDQTSRSFTSISSKNEFMMDCVWILVIAFTLKLIHTYITVSRCNAEDVIHPQEKEPASVKIV